MKIALITLSLFLLNACGNSYIKQNCCAVIEFSDEDLIDENGYTTPAKIDEQRIIAIDAYKSCFCKS